jgi:hypothetical protein
VSAHHRPTAALAVLVIALLALPGVASARPADDSTGPRSQLVAEPSTPAPTVVRTVIKDNVPALPIALAGAALLIAVAGTGYARVRIAPMRHQHLH